MSSPPKLPKWARFDEKSGRIVIDPDVAYPVYLKLLGLGPTAYNVGAIRHCITRDIRGLCSPDEQFPWVIAFHPADQESKQRWMSANLENSGDPAGDDERGFREAGAMIEKLRSIRARFALMEE